MKVHQRAYKNTGKVTNATHTIRMV